MDEDVGKRFEAYGWRTHAHRRSRSRANRKALDEASTSTTRPFLILARTHIGNGAPNKHDTHKVHGEPLGKEETEATKQALGWPLDKPFYVPDEVRALWDKRAEELQTVHAEWNAHEKSWLAGTREGGGHLCCDARKAVPADLLAQLAARRRPKTDATRASAGASRAAGGGAGAVAGRRRRRSGRLDQDAA